MRNSKITSANFELTTLNIEVFTMNYKEIEILSLRGFIDKQKLMIAKLIGPLGSGLTVIVESYNYGKSKIYDAFRAWSQIEQPRFTEGRINKSVGDKVEIAISRTDGGSWIVKKTAIDGCETEHKLNGLAKTDVRFLTLPAIKTFSPRQT